MLETYLLVVYNFTYLHFLPCLWFTVSVTLGCFTMVLILLVCLLDCEVHPVLISLIFILLTNQPWTTFNFSDLVLLLDGNVISRVPASSRCSRRFSLLPGSVDDSSIRNAST